MKKICLLVSLSIFIILSSCQLEQKNNVVSQPSQTSSYHTAQIESDRQELSSVNDLEATSTDIVRGVLSNDAKQKIMSKNGIAILEITVSSLKIDKVYQGPLKVGDIINLGERYYILDKNNEKTLYYSDNYLPSDIGQEYLFFLRKQDDKDAFWSGIYLPNGIEQGRYPVLGPAQKNTDIALMTSQELNLGTDNADHYKELFAEVRRKYMS